MKKYSLQLIALFALVIIGVIALAGGRFAAHAQGSSQVLSGWAWSSNIGWLSFNSADTGAGGGPYSVSVDSSGNFSGYAWSPNIGWVNFGPNSCGSPANVVLSGTSAGTVTGWAQAVAADNNGWNGCIQLSDSQYFTSPSGSGISMDPTSGVFSGYAWGGTNVGWLQFDTSVPVTICPTGDTTCTCQPDDPTCNNEAAVALSVLNSGIYASFTTVIETGGNASANIQWSSTNVVPDTCSLTGSDWSYVSNKSAMNIASGCNTGSYNTANLQFTGVSNNQTVTLSIQAQDPTQLPRVVYIPSQPITITFTKSSPPVGNTCVAPNNSASACGPTDSGTATTVSSCPNPATVECQYICITGYTAKNNMCVKSSIQEI